MSREIIKGRQQICNGYSRPRNHYGKRKIQYISRLLPKCREILKNYVSQWEYSNSLYYGERCKNDFDIIARMESTNQRKLFKHGIKWAIVDALLDCADSDYYYKYEKDWGGNNHTYPFC